MSWETDVIVVGCGIAGGIAALCLADSGKRVTVLTRSTDPHEANTYYAQGGIVYRGPGDSPAHLVEDILRAGAYRNNVEAATLLAEKGPQLVERLLIQRLRVPFDREDGGYMLIREGSHSIPRILHVADATGKAIQRALVREIRRHPNIEVRPAHTAVDLILSHVGGEPSLRCTGVWVLDRQKGKVLALRAPYTVLATGGYAYLYARTTNPPTARGDGIAIAYRSGARCTGLEYVQFHPTAFAQPGAPTFLISEAVRGAGARLVHADGRPFMGKYAPEWKDLAPRDVVARAIFEEMRRHHLPHVYLDLRSALPPTEIRRRFPHLYARCLTYGVDITRDLIPVAPAAHYTCGGVHSDLHGRTDILGLYAIGEVAWTGLHGANRLASTSLLEGLVWGVQAAQDIVQASPLEKPPPPLNVAPPQLHKMPSSAMLQEWERRLRQTMWQYVGIVRDREGLSYARTLLTTLQEEIEAVYRSHAITDALVGLRNMVQVALLVVRAAAANPFNEGCHYRTDAISTQEHVS